MKVHHMWDNYPTLQQDLADALQVIDSSIKIREKRIERNVKEMIHSGGKLLRPAYFLLCSQIGEDYNRERAIAVAAALEVLHLATLVHDDVIDDAKTRRGVETIQAKYGKNYAVYTGDYLFCVCFKIMAQHAKELSIIELNTNSMERILLGELDQMSMRNNYDMTVKEYLKQIAGKTAQLFALSCFLGAETSQATLAQKHLARKIGHNMGMAFQIMDDILDYTQDSRQLGKPVLNDVKQGVYSLPLIYAMRKNRAAFRPLLEKGEDMTLEDQNALLRLIETHQGVEQAKELAAKYTEKALGLIGKLPKGPYQEQMFHITSALLKRNL